MIQLYYTCKIVLYEVKANIITTTATNTLLEVSFNITVMAISNYPNKGGTSTAIDHKRSDVGKREKCNGIKSHPHPITLLSKLSGIPHLFRVEVDVIKKLKQAYILL